MIIKCDAEGKQVFDELVKIGMKSGFFTSPEALNVVLESSELIEPEKKPEEVKEA